MPSECKLKGDRENSERKSERQSGMQNEKQRKKIGSIR
jgi:hypothetical protein